jgi:hypothetical protein
MGSSLNNTTPANTYPALIKVGNNTPIDATLKTLSDGNGNNLPIQASSSTINFTGTTTGLPFQDFALYPYTVVVATSGGTISTITSATSPSGANLIGATGWAFAISGTTVNVTHTLGNTIFVGLSQGIGTSPSFLRNIKSFNGNLTNNYSIIQNSTFTVVSFYSITAANGGFATGTSVSDALTIIILSTVYS